MAGRTPEQKARAVEAQRNRRRAKAREASAPVKAETMGTVDPKAGVARAEMEKARADRRHGEATRPEVTG